MAPADGGFLVTRTPAGFGEAFSLAPGERCTLGRSPDNVFVLNDDLCSRFHAEVYAAPDGAGWVWKDLGSLNGSSVNGKRVRGEVPIQPGDEIRAGKTELVFVTNLGEIGIDSAEIDLGGETAPDVTITKRLGRSRFLAAAKPSGTIAALLAHRTARPSLPEALAHLYKLALEMAEARTPAELCEKALAALLRATPAEFGAVMALKDGRDLDLVAQAARGAQRSTYHKTSSFVTREVLSTRQAVLAEHVAGDSNLRARESLTELQVESLVCAPVLADDQPLGVLHLYTTSVEPRLNADDLELALAVAHHLGAVWEKARVQAGLSAEVRSLKDRMQLESELIGRSAPLKRVEGQAARVAATRATVLIRGESGTGKELVARAIHANSPRRDAPLVCLNCAALTETLLESELFGHEKGSFTGATERMIGKFEAADGGTIFLDEIGEMAPATQAKFLRVLEGQAFERVGGNVPIKVDVRVVAATNRQLEEAVREGKFRKDLYFRLQVVQIDVPPLRDRLDDVPLLAEHFLKRFARETGRKVRGFTPEAEAKLRGHDWPGNIRELRNAIERAVALGGGAVVDAADIWVTPLSGDRDEAPAAAPYEPKSVEEVEKDHIARTLAHTEWHKSRAAEILGIERSTLDRKIKAYGLAR